MGHEKTPQVPDVNHVNNAEVYNLGWRFPLKEFLWNRNLKIEKSDKIYKFEYVYSV